MQVKVATIKHITGKRLYLEYDDFDTDDNGELWRKKLNIHSVKPRKRKSCQTLLYVVLM